MLKTHYALVVIAVNIEYCAVGCVAASNQGSVFERSRDLMAALFCIMNMVLYGNDEKDKKH